MVAIALEEYIIKNNLRNESNINGNIKIFLTDLESNFINVARKLLNDDYINIKKLE